MNIYIYPYDYFSFCNGPQGVIQPYSVVDSWPGEFPILIFLVECRIGFLERHVSDGIVLQCSTIPKSGPERSVPFYSVD